MTSHMVRVGMGIVSAVALASSLPNASGAETGSATNATSRVRFVLSPVFGWDRDDLEVHGPRGATSTQTDTKPEYGLFALVSHPNLTASDFLFFSRVNKTDVLGNFFFANYYVNSETKLTWNVGAGHLYHRILPDNEDILVSVPMVKTGPRVRVPAWHLSVNPYVGYAWERVRTQHGDIDNDSYLFGLSGSWQWRMLQTTLNYYYQDSQGVDENFQTLRGRVDVFLSRHWGFVARVDYMEHMSTRDTSLLFGPTCVF